MSSKPALLLLAALSGAALAQNATSTGALPSCAAPCVADASSALGCDVTQLSCLCQNAPGFVTNWAIQSCLDQYCCDDEFPQVDSICSSSTSSSISSAPAPPMSTGTGSGSWSSGIGSGSGPASLPPYNNASTPAASPSAAPSLPGTGLPGAPPPVIVTSTSTTLSGATPTGPSSSPSGVITAGASGLGAPALSMTALTAALVAAFFAC